ncbi:MAG: hypothetical protein ACOZBZ_00895 [Patescibacteria group bacterium]
MKIIRINPNIVISILLFTFYFLLFTFPAYAACTPSSDYSSCSELNPDWNLDILGYKSISGNLNFINFQHETDPRAPQFNTLIEGNLAPSVTSLYQIGGIKKPDDAPADFATLVGFSTNANQAILVPNSGYDIGGGYEVLVIYADQNSITLKYTPDDNIAVAGYTLYLENIRVDPALVAYYNQLNQAGRDELPALMAGMKIGEAIGNEILVAIRDTGTFLDPRWLNDWWKDLPAETRELLLKAMSIQKPTVSPPQTCDYSNSGDRTSRPVRCDACNQTNKMTPACAEGFTVSDSVKYRRSEAGTSCEGNPWLERTWGGEITIDPSEVKIPFVGKKQQEDEQKYLADYFEGTNEYYKNYEKYWLDWVNHAGVWRKLSPMEYQNQLKKQLVNRAVATTKGKIGEGGIHDYKLNYQGRLCWDFPFITDAFLAVLTKIGLPVVEGAAKFTHFCVFTNDTTKFWAAKTAFSLFNLASPIKVSTWATGDAEATLSLLISHFPPDPSDKDYAQKWDAWKKSDGGKWFNLWQVMSMASREDTPGNINPYLGRKRDDEFKILNPKAQIEKVPHVARLYETGGTIQKTLFPAKSKQVLGEKTSLAEANLPPPNPGFEASGSCSKSGNTYTVNAIVSLTNAPGLSDISIHIGSEYWHTCPNSDACTNLVAPSWSVAGKPGDILSGPSFNFRSDVVVPNFRFSATYSIRLTADGCEFVGGPPKPPGPTCGLPEPRPVNLCQKTAITDSNPADDLCCQSPIKISLSATDQFINEDYLPCGKEIECDPTGYICHDKCDEEKEKGVNRQIGVALSHPYLGTIWNQTGNPLSGVFNIFRPYGVPKFVDIDAASQVSYSYKDTSPPIGGSVTPGVGKFYFPYLGGIQLAKQWLIRTLTPYQK